MKECSVCKQTLPLDEFAFRNKTTNARHGQCNTCRRATAKRSYENNKDTVIAKTKIRRKGVRDWYQQLKSTMKCCVCAESDPACLDFHHLDPTEKEFDPSASLAYGKKAVVLELNRCACLCANCHRKEHAGRLNAPLVKLEITQVYET